MEEAFQLALDSAPFLLKGAYYTVVLSLGGMFFGLLLGFGLALMRLSRFKSVSWLARIYVSFFRGTPLLVQLFVIYYGLPQLGMELDPLPAALIGFSLNMAAYACEILRAAIGSIERGQWEAAASIGMTRAQTCAGPSCRKRCARHCRRWATASFRWSRTRRWPRPFRCRSCSVRRS